MMSKGRDASEFFSDVVKNVVAKSVEVKKMVYMYLSHYCDFNHQCRELALLSINSFQKDLAASNQLVRESPAHFFTANNCICMTSGTRIDVITRRAIALTN